MRAAQRLVTLQPVLPPEPPIRLDLVGDDVLTGGVGQWSTLNRPLRRDEIEFAGVTGFTYVLPLLLDGMEARRGVDESVERYCRILHDWASVVRKQTGQPTVLRATGPLQTDKTVRWVISDLAWGAKVRDDRTGERIQQHVTVTLTEYQTAAVRKTSAKKSRDRKGKK